MLEFVDSGLYFVQDENNFINQLLQVGSGSSSLQRISNRSNSKADKKSDLDLSL